MGALPDFFFFCSADHERDWPPCKVVFFRVGNQCAECEKQQQQQRFDIFPPRLGDAKGSPYLQHRVATFLVQHGRRHQNHPTGNPFLKSCRFRLCLVQAAVVNLFILNLVCFISVCPYIPEKGRLENTYSCCGFWLWSWLAAVVNLFVLNFCASFPFAYARNGQILEHVRTKKKQKKPCPAVQGTWLHVGPFLACVLTQRFSTQPLELYIPRLSRCTTQ